MVINFVSNLIIPSLISTIIIYGMLKKIQILKIFNQGAKEGLLIGSNLLGTIILLMLATSMFSASGGFDLIFYILKPIINLFKIPCDLIPLIILRPISSSAALVIYKNILEKHGPDGIIGMIASLLYGCSETIVYVITTFYSAINITKTRHTLFVAFLCYIVSIVTSFLLIHSLHTN